MEQKNFFRIRQKSTGWYFDGGRRGVFFSEAGMRFEKAGPITAALLYFEKERLRSVELSEEHYPEFSESVLYWRSVDKALQSENFEIVHFRETITEIGTIPAR